MEKRSRRRIRDLVAPAAFQGLSQNEIGCARISMMARSTNAPFKGRIQKRKTNHLQIITFGLQRTAGPYKGVESRCDAVALGSSISVAAPFVRRCLTGSTMAPFSHPAHRTGQADFPHPALGQNFTPSPTARRAQAGSGVRAQSARKDARVDRSRPCDAWSCA